MHDHRDVIARRDDVEAHVLRDLSTVEAVIGLLDRAEATAGAPLVDESERARLHAIASGTDDPASHWHPLVARRGDDVVGYAGVVLPSTPGGPAVTDVAVARDRPMARSVLEVLLAAIEALGWRHGADRVRAWLRHATAPAVSAATDQGYGVGRRLAVLGRDLADPPPGPPAVPAGMRLRAFRAGIDDEAVVGVLAAAYADSADDGWDLGKFADRRDYDWFRAEDLLLLEHVDGGLAGLHWTKRRGGGVGEVYNLAVHPDEQGEGLGAVLLRAGLTHLAEVGCREVLLWVDLSNERAVRLYTSNGFHTRWEDVALTRTLRGEVGD